MHQATEKEARRLLVKLEQYWQKHYGPEELHHRINSLLPLVREALARDSADTRRIISTYERSLKGRVSAEEISEANAALARILAEMGAVVISLMPLAFITLPGLLALARHFGIELLPMHNERLGNGGQKA